MSNEEYRNLIMEIIKNIQNTDALELLYELAKKLRD